MNLQIDITDSSDWAGYSGT